MRINVRVRAPFPPLLQFYEDNGKTCAVILNYLFHGWDGIEPRNGADKDTFTLEDLFADMGIDEGSMFSRTDAPYEVSPPHSFNSYFQVSLTHSDQ